MAPQSNRQLALLVAIHLRGAIDAESLAEYVGLEPSVVAPELEALERDGLVTFRQGRLGGFRLTPEGRAQLRPRVSAELTDTGATELVAGLYRRFEELNERVLQTCTSWQLKGTEPNAHDDPEYDARVVAELAAAHDMIRPVLDELAAVLPRFGSHRRRLETALANIEAGEHDWFTKPMFPSYHSSWFELHEDLLVTLGQERDEGR